MTSVTKAAVGPGMAPMAQAPAGNAEIGRSLKQVSQDFGQFKKDFEALKHSVDGGSRCGHAHGGGQASRGDGRGHHAAHHRHGGHPAGRAHDLPGRGHHAAHCARADSAKGHAQPAGSGPAPGQAGGAAGGSQPAPGNLVADMKQGLAQLGDMIKNMGGLIDKLQALFAKGGNGAGQPQPAAPQPMPALPDPTGGGAWAQMKSRSADLVSNLSASWDRLSRSFADLGRRLNGTQPG